MKICIIGGRGNFGKFFTKIFTSQKQTVFSIGRSNISDLKKTVQNSDVIIISLPAEACKLYYEDLESLVKKNQLVIDISSVMSENIKYLSKLKCQTVFLHPLFATSIQNLEMCKYVLAPLNLKNNKKLTAILNFLKNSGATVIKSTIDKHESVMANIQALPHFSNILLAKVIADSGVNTKEVSDFMTAFGRLQFDTLSRIFAQSSEIYASIQFNNKTFLKVLDMYEINFKRMVRIIKDKDYIAYDYIFKDIISKFSPLLKNSFEESQILLKSLPSNSKKVGCLGPVGSYSEVAAEYLIPNTNLILADTITEVIKMVNDSQLDFGVVPIENSIHGSVVETVDALYQNKLYIERELIVPINHCAASLSSDLKPDSVEMVLSHSQALGQCSEYIKLHFPNAKQVVTNSTSLAFKKIADERLVKAVAIGTETAAKKYRLEILDRCIQNKENNETKFVLISKTFDINSKGKISSFVLIPKEDRPGLLFDLLKNFKDNNLNLIKIESRPLKSKLGTYVFYVDINGNFKDSAVVKALSGIKKESDVVFLGSYNREKIYDKKS